MLSYKNDLSSAEQTKLDALLADVDITNILPDCFNARAYERLNLSDGTKYATMCTNNRTIKFIAKPVSDYAGCHILTIQK